MANIKNYQPVLRIHRSILNEAIHVKTICTLQLLTLTPTLIACSPIDGSGELILVLENAVLLDVIAAWGN